MEVDNPFGSAEQRAGDLLDRLNDLGGLDAGLTEEDLYDTNAACREPFRTLCAGLASLARAVSVAVVEGDHPASAELEPLLRAVETHAATSAASVHLDRSLALLARSLSPPRGEGNPSRIDALEEVVQFVQASTMLLVRTPTPSPRAREVSESIRSLARALGAPQSRTAASTLESCRDAVLALCPDSDPAAAAGEGSPLLRESALTEDQLQVLRRVHRAMREEYKVRRQTLSKRAAVTLQSLQCSARVQNPVEVRSIIERGLSRMGDEPSVDFGEVFEVTRADLQHLQSKVTAAGMRTNFRSSVKGVLIGKVPDRGGRVGDKRAGGPAMPAWAPRKSGGGGGGGGGGRGGHHNHGKGAKNNKRRNNKKKP